MNLIHTLMVMKTRYNIVSETGDGMGFAARLTQEGEACRMWIRNPDAKSVGDNIVDKVGDFEDLLADADRSSDVFVFDASGNGVMADYVKQNGFAVLGGSVLADKLERDRTFGAEVMQDAGIEIPHTVSFSSFEEGVEFVRNNPDVRWVYKPSKQLGDLSPSHVSYDTEDLIEMLENISKEVDIVDPQFELQAFEKGVAFSTELWFQHGEFIPPLTNHTLERKELMNEDIGPSGGCVGNLTWFCEGCRVCDEAKQFTKWAKQERYHGMLDLNVIVAKRDGQIYGLEFTPRFGYDASPTLFWELARDGLAKFFADVARGQVSSLDCRDGFAGALRVTINPWPTERHSAEENVPIRGIDKEMMDHLYLYNVKKNDSGLCSAGAWGIICLFTNHSISPIRCLDKPLQACRDLRMKNKQFRTDLTKRFQEDIKTLESLGVEINIGEIT
jgi:phosphoribosylamine--glycine ligase